MVNPTARSTTHPAPAPATPPCAVLFDAYGTLFDVYSVAELAEHLCPGQGQALSVAWRDKQIDYTRLVTTSNHGAHYQPFSVLTRAALIYALRKVTAATTAALNDADFLLEHAPQIELLLAQYQHLDAFPENRGVLQQLKARGVRCGILSNGDATMLAAAVHSAGMDGLLDAVISVDAVRKFKTHPDAYALGPSTLKLAAPDILFVSSNGWDALGATWFGYRTLWVNRQRQPLEQIGPPPTRIGTDLNAVLDFFPV